MEYGLIGEHLGHSYSAEIHEAIADYKYELKELAPDELEAFLNAKEFKGINVTIPYKQAVIPYLDEISDQARAIGAVNTIVNRNGRLYGANTDFAGMAALVERLGIDMHDKKVLICGTGGTSRTAMAVARSMGASEIFRLSRHALADREQYPEAADNIISYDEAASLHTDAKVIINTTPAGMYPHVQGKAIDISPFSALEGVIDAVYNPLRTDLVMDAIERGIPAGGGLFMLAAQAVYACGLFLNREMGEEETQKAYDLVLHQKQNIVLTGMPTCGKTTIGTRISQSTGRQLLDTDEIAVSIMGMSIADYSASNGEKAFRDRESEAVSKAALGSGIVIATGGGAILRPENVRALKRNGRLIFIDRPLEKLMPSDDRPFSSNAADLKKRYEERYDIYCATADERVDGSGTIEEVANAVMAAAAR